jgi:hypothetical protein
MLKTSKLEMNIMHLNNGVHLKVKHIVGTVVAVPFVWAFLIVAFSF